MENHKIYIKGMVCDRCISVLQADFERAGIPVQNIQLGSVIFSSGQHSGSEILSSIISRNGFEIIRDKKATLVERIKELVTGFISADERTEKNKRFSDLLSSELHLNYDSASSAFSESEGITLEQFIIRKKNERVCDLLRSSSVSLTEISFRCGYSSVHHLSRQFKAINGISPSVYRLRNAGLQT